MKVWKSKEKRPEGIWVSEIRLKAVSVLRKAKVNKLLKLSKEEFNAVVL